MQRAPSPSPRNSGESSQRRWLGGQCREHALIKEAGEMGVNTGGRPRHTLEIGDNQAMGTGAGWGGASEQVSLGGDPQRVRGRAGQPRKGA